MPTSASSWRRRERIFYDTQRKYYLGYRLFPDDNPARYRAGIRYPYLGRVAVNGVVVMETLPVILVIIGFLISATVLIVAVWKSEHRANIGEPLLNKPDPVPDSDPIHQAILTERKLKEKSDKENLIPGHCLYCCSPNDVDITNCEKCGAPLPIVKKLKVVQPWDFHTYSTYPGFSVMCDTAMPPMDYHEAIK